MAVPDYQSLMLPLLKLAADRNEHTLSEAKESYRVC
jgi:restriction endonuclease Mrr